MGFGAMEADPIQYLLNSDFLRGAKEEQLRAISPPPNWVKLATGETLIEQGSFGEDFYFLVNGRLRAFFTDESGSQRMVGEIMPGEGIGEMSLPSTTVRAKYDSDLIRFSGETYLDLLRKFPDAALHVARSVTRRPCAQSFAKASSGSSRSIALIPISPSVEIEGFARRLSDQLVSFGVVKPINRKALPASLGAELSRDDRASGSATKEISNLVANHRQTCDLIMFEADLRPTAWTHLCINEADLVLLVGHVGAAPDLSEVEETVLRNIDPQLAPAIHLVLLHPSEWTKHCGANCWLGLRQVSDYSHLRQGNDGDFARLARIITGHGVGVVLGSGGARGLAQIGVLRALVEAGIPIDRIGGSSIGSMIGAHAASGMDVMQILEVERWLWCQIKPLSDVTFPAMSILRGRRFHDALKRMFGSWEIEDLPIRYFCVSSNLTTTDCVVHDNGALWAAVRASGSIPGAGPPMFWNGDVLVDGAVLNHLPADIMRQRFGGLIFAVDVSQKIQLRAPDDLHEPLSGWRILWQQLNGSTSNHKLPSIFDILYQSATLSSARLGRQAYEHADVVFSPPTERFGLLRYDAIDELVEIGYRHAMEKLATLENLPALEVTRSKDRQCTIVTSKREPTALQNAAPMVTPRGSVTNKAG